MRKSHQAFSCSRSVFHISNPKMLWKSELGAPLQSGVRHGATCEPGPPLIALRQPTRRRIPAQMAVRGQRRAGVRTEHYLRQEASGLPLLHPCSRSFSCCPAVPEFTVFGECSGTRACARKRPDVIDVRDVIDSMKHEVDKRRRSIVEPVVVARSRYIEHTRKTPVGE